MNYEIITKEDRDGLLAQRLAQHEQAYFELEVQLAEVADLAPALDDEEKRKVETVHSSLLKKRSEVASRINTVRRLLNKTEENPS